MTSDGGRRQLLYALRLLLRPIARLLIRTGIRFEEFAALVRGVYVESAIRDGTGCLGVPTRERVVAVTGIARRQIDYYIDNEGILPTADPTLAAALMEILHKWHMNPGYVGPYGIPLELEFARPADRNFRSLVTLVDPKVNPATALEELLRLGVVMPSGETHFRAVSRTLMMPDPTSTQLIEHLGRTLPRLAATLEYNMDPRHPDKRLERYVTADGGLLTELVPEFEEHVRLRAADFLVDLDNWLAPHAADEEHAADRVETGVNVFLYADPPIDDASLSSLLASSGTAKNR
ncbi:MAG: DUF6502 family protein [Steroidobacteraceae bacterium]